MDKTTRRNILVIGESSMTEGLRSMFESYCRKAKVPNLQLRILTDMTHGCLTKETKTSWGADATQFNSFLTRLKKAINQYNPRIILCNDACALQYITGKHRSCSLIRGSVYLIDDIPCIIFDSLRLKDGGAKLKVVPHAGWLLMNDLKKAMRWYDGKQKAEPAFSYRVCDTVGEIESLRDAANTATSIGMDIETSGRGTTGIISASGYAVQNGTGGIQSYVIPFLFPKIIEEKIDRYVSAWNDNELKQVLQLMQEIHGTEAVKILQNGSYDSHYYIKYRMPLKNYLYDTAVGFHSIWPTLPKRIDFICSITSDYYRYWKDEGKVDEKEDDKNTKLPQAKEDWRKYLRYNAQDCHNTLLAAIWQLNVLTQVPWAMSNFVTSMRQTLGPAISMSMRGVNCNKSLQLAYENMHYEQSENALIDLRIMANDNNFNPNSPVQVASFIYDVLQATPLPQKGSKKKKSGGRSADEKALKIIQTQGVILERTIEQIWKVKKPKNNISKYGTYQRRTTGAGNYTWNGLQLAHGRWRYKLNPCGTKFGRYSCKSSDFWDGTQVQNIPYEMRHIIEPDEGYILFDFDYSKADFWHTAFASEDPDMMAIVTDTSIDTHCYHAAKFFSKPYKEIYKGYKNKVHWVVDSLTGVRQNAKRICYGANYLMGGFTLFMTMGKEAVDATAINLCHNIAGWSLKNYMNFCQSLINFYFDELYPNLMPWLNNTIQKVSRRGNMATCCGGRTFTFFANLMASNDAQRELAAFYGQGGTASTINKAMDNIYFNGWDSQDAHILLQVHDSIIGQVKYDKLHKLVELKELMEVTNEMHDREFVIPVEGSVGLGWGFRMCDWHPNVTLNEVKQADEKWRKKNTELISYTIN